MLAVPEQLLAHEPQALEEGGTLRLLCTARHAAAKAAALMPYVNHGGPSEAGLRRRRKAEGTLWSASPDQGSKPSPDRVSPSQVSSHPNPLVAVPRFQQRDRTCFSSMALPPGPPPDGWSAACGHRSAELGRRWKLGARPGI
ncbi:MAG: hypothetical protein ACK5UG_01800 [Synechococcaceae cyanobacterium]